MKKLIKKQWVQEILAFVASLYINLVWHTSKWAVKIHPESQKIIDEDEGFILCFWHGRLLMMAPQISKIPAPKHMLISAHADGKIISKTMSYFSVKTISGSTKKSGTKALREILNLLKSNAIVGFTPDGPRGPRYSIAPGVLQCAYMSQKKIIPISYSCKRKKILKSWDRFILAYPFNKGCLLIGAPILPPRNKENFEKTSSELKTKLDALTNEADQWPY